MVIIDKKTFHFFMFAFFTQVLKLNQAEKLSPCRKIRNINIKIMLQ